MSYELPGFDELRDMAQNNPEQLERLRVALCDQLIQEAPSEYRRKLRGLQFQIDMERRRAKTPMAACIAISGMMHESFDRLREALSSAERPIATKRSQSNAAEQGKVLPFQRA